MEITSNDGSGAQEVDTRSCRQHCRFIVCILH